MRNLNRTLPGFLSILAGCCLFLVFERFNWLPGVFLFPALLTLVAATAEKSWHAFLFGILVSAVGTIGALYWIVPSTRDFTHLSYWGSVLLFLPYGLVGNLHLAVYLLLLKKAFDKKLITRLPAFLSGFVFALGASALFVSLEYLIPHPFDWSLGHSLYRQYWLTQIVELSGISILTFVVWVTGTVGGIYCLPTSLGLPKKLRWTILPALLLGFALVFSYDRLSDPRLKEETLRVALLQANAVEMERKATNSGEKADIQKVIDKYTQLTDALLKAEPSDLVVWPESVLAFELDEPTDLSAQIKNAVKRWKIPLVVGASSKSRTQAFKYYNAAYLLTPSENEEVKIASYFKNQLMLIGEYLPLSDYLPDSLKNLRENYRLDRGNEQEPFVLPRGEKLGISICFEAVSSSYHREILRNGIQALLNISNDSWFGDTSGPFQHLGFAIFRAIEGRIPMIRAGNTGPSFITDEFGRVLYQSPIGKEEVIRATLSLPQKPKRTLYVGWGDWFSGVCLLLTSLGWVSLKRTSLKEA